MHLKEIPCGLFHERLRRPDAFTHPRASLTRFPGEPACLEDVLTTWEILLRLSGDSLHETNRRQAANMIYLTFGNFRRGDARRLAPPESRNRRS